MILYHGSTVCVEYPEIRIGETCLDFGPGFYTTSSEAQAERWARIKMRRENAAYGYVSVYEFDEDAARSESKIFQYTGADMEWLQFVVHNRRGNWMNDGTDIHVGPVADDNGYRSIRLFETGVLDAEDTIKRLKTEALHDQWVFHSEKALTYVRFIRAVEILQGES